MSVYLRQAKAIGELNTEVGNFIILSHTRSQTYNQVRDFFTGVRDELVTGTTYNHYEKVMFIRPEGSFTYGEYVNPEIIWVSVD